MLICMKIVLIRRNPSNKCCCCCCCFVVVVVFCGIYLKCHFVGVLPIWYVNDLNSVCLLLTYLFIQDVCISVSADNESIEELDLSWNNFRLKSGVVLCQGLAVNVFSFLFEPHHGTRATPFCFSRLMRNVQISICITPWKTVSSFNFEPNHGKGHTYFFSCPMRNGFTFIFDLSRKKRIHVSV